MKYGLDVATAGEWSDPHRIIDLAIAAEEAGWDGFFLWDVLQAEDDGPLLEPWMVLPAIAVVTQRIAIGALVTPLPRTLPWDVARRITTLDNVCDGRLIFGAGLGWRAEEFRRIGMPQGLEERAGLLDESLSVIDLAATGEPVRFAGEHYRVDGLRIRPTPVQRPRVPTWVAAGWPRRAPLERALRWDGVYLMAAHQVTRTPVSPDDVRDVAALVAAERRSSAGFDLAVNVFTPGEADGGQSAIDAMAMAGATWVIEQSPDTFEQHVALVQRGPIRVTAPAGRLRPGSAS